MANRPARNEQSTSSAVSVLVIQPDERVPLGRFSKWLEHDGVHITVIQPFRGDKIPTEIEADGLIVLGGTMTAHSLEQFPWLADIKALFHRAAAASVPTLGICLGAQLLAVAFDGEVTSDSPIGPEIGVVDIEWTDDSVDDALVGDLSQSFRATSFHYDGISALPAQAVLLGRGERYPNQVFRLGNAVGVQFHPEATPELFNNWCAADAVERPKLAELFEQKTREVEAADDEIASQATKLAHNFVKALQSALQVQRS